jgi:hypothetical protein
MTKTYRQLVTENASTNGFKAGKKVRVVFVDPDTNQRAENHGVVDRIEGKNVFVYGHARPWGTHRSPSGKAHRYGDSTFLELAEEFVSEDGEAPTNVSGGIAGTTGSPPVSKKRQRQYQTAGATAQKTSQNIVGRELMSGATFGESASGPNMHQVARSFGWGNGSPMGSGVGDDTTHYSHPKLEDHVLEVSHHGTDPGWIHGKMSHGDFDFIASGRKPEDLHEYLEKLHAEHR